MSLDSAWMRLALVVWGVMTLAVCARRQTRLDAIASTLMDAWSGVSAEVERKEA